MSRTTTIIAIAVLLALCVAPMIPAEESDADSDSGSFRMNDYYLYRATIQLDPGDYVGSYISTYWIYKDGSLNDAAMEAYLRDPTNQSISVPGDDQEEIRGEVEEAITINAYMSTNSGNLYNDMFYYGGHTARWQLVQEPYNSADLTYFVLAGDTFRINMSIVDNEGRTYSYRVAYEYDSQSVNGESFSRTMDASTTVTVSYGGSGNGLYYDVTYSASGFTEPNGSPIVYVAICAVITIAILAVLIYAGMKPKWSK